MQIWFELLKNDDYLGIKKYIKSGGDLSETNDSGESVLSCAIMSRCELETIILLIKSGADVFDFNEEGVSIFDMAIAYNNIDMVNLLIESKINVNETKRRSGFTALMGAACYGRVEIAKILIKNGVDQTAKDSKGFTAVDFARKMNKKSVLGLLEFDENQEKNTGYAR